MAASAGDTVPMSWAIRIPIRDGMFWFSRWMDELLLVLVWYCTSGFAHGLCCLYTLTHPIPIHNLRQISRHLKQWLLDSCPVEHWMKRFGYHSWLTDHVYQQRGYDDFSSCNSWIGLLFTQVMPQKRMKCDLLVHCWSVSQICRSCLSCVNMSTASKG